MTSTRYAARVDANQAEIVSALRGLNYVSVFPAHTIGHGFPDLVCAIGGTTYLVEIKDGSKPPSARKLTPDQVKFHTEWKAPIEVINSVDEALSWAERIRGQGLRSIPFRGVVT